MKEMVEKKCMIHNCELTGRRIGRLGDTIELIYCMKHEDMGVRVLNFLINSKFRYKFTKFLDEVRQDLFIKNEPPLSEESNKQIADYVQKMIEVLDKELLDEE